MRKIVITITAEDDEAADTALKWVVAELEAIDDGESVSFSAEGHMGTWKAEGEDTKS